MVHRASRNQKMQNMLKSRYRPRIEIKINFVRLRVVRKIGLKVKYSPLVIEILLKYSGKGQAGSPGRTSRQK